MMISQNLKLPCRLLFREHFCSASLLLWAPTVLPALSTFIWIQSPIPMFSAVLSFISPFDDGTLGVSKSESKSDWLSWLSSGRRKEDGTTCSGLIDFSSIHSMITLRKYFTLRIGALMKAFEGDTVYDLPEVVMCDKKWSGYTGVNSHNQHYKAADIRACLKGVLRCAAESTFVLLFICNLTWSATLESGVVE